MPSLVIAQLVLNAKSVMYSIAFLLGTGKEPGRPIQVGQRFSFGFSVSATLHLQNIFELVFNSTCVSMPIVGTIFILHHPVFEVKRQKIPLILSFEQNLIRYYQY